MWTGRVVEGSGVEGKGVCVLTTSLCEGLEAEQVPPPSSGPRASIPTLPQVCLPQLGDIDLPW